VQKNPGLAKYKPGTIGGYARNAIQKMFGSCAMDTSFVPLTFLARKRIRRPDFSDLKFLRVTFPRSCQYRDRETA
jgi:hypothetical protein